MLYNQASYWLFKALQEYHTEEMTEEAIIKRQHAARAQQPEAQERLLVSLINWLSGHESSLPARETHSPEPCDLTPSRRAL